MPVKLPAPDDGTFEQAGPNGAMAEPEPELAGAADDADAFGDDDDEPLEPHAAVPSATAAAMAPTARNLFFMIFSFSVGWPVAGCGGRHG
jgi:hypothetical protein